MALGNGLIKDLKRTNPEVYKGHIEKIKIWYVKYPRTQKEFENYVDSCSENVISKQEKFKLKLFFQQNKSCKNNKNMI
jgi:hypothetical protein